MERGQTSRTDLIISALYFCSQTCLMRNWLQQKESTKTVPAYVEYCIVQPGDLWPNQLKYSRCGVSSSVDFTGTEAV